MLVLREQIVLERLKMRFLSPWLPNWNSDLRKCVAPCPAETPYFYDNSAWAARSTVR